MVTPTGVLCVRTGRGNRLGRVVCARNATLRAREAVQHLCNLRLFLRLPMCGIVVSIAVKGAGDAGTDTGEGGDVWETLVRLNTARGVLRLAFFPDPASSTNTDQIRLYRSRLSTHCDTRSLPSCRPENVRVRAALTWWASY